jgi:CheY-like chemotaxis protein
MGLQLFPPKPAILVVDDDRDTVDSTVLVLGLLGYEAEGVYGADEALAAARLRPPRAVLLDAAMPGLDGYALARQLRLLPGMADTLIICVSGYGTPDHRARALAAGCDLHFIKPIDWQELARALAGERHKEPA